MRNKTNPENESNVQPMEEMASLLVVEDDEDLLEFMASGLENKFKVHAAANGREGLLTACEHIPDLVVTDIMMPFMNGIELCGELKTNPETSHIPVIMLTAKTSIESQLEGLKTGADDYITKPFHMVLLEARIHNLLSSRINLRDRFIKEFQASESGADIENGLDRELWGRIHAIIDARCCDPGFSPDILAHEMNMSPRTLQRKIKALADRSPINLILYYRLKKGAELLKQPDLNVTEIAFEVGFSDSNHFYKQFKNEYGMSPSDYRSASPG